MSPAPSTHDTYVIGRTYDEEAFRLLLLLIPVVVLAQSGIDGTWRIDLSKTQLDSKPRVYELKDGMYSCSCDRMSRSRPTGRSQSKLALRRHRKAQPW